MLLIKAQLEEKLERYDAARETLARAVKLCPDCVPIWLTAAHLEERQGLGGKARSMLEVARLKNTQVISTLLEKPLTVHPTPAPIPP